MYATVATLAVPTTVSTVEDLGSCVRAINSATAVGDTAEAKTRLGALQSYLRGLSDKDRVKHEDEILAALSAFPHNRGVRVTSWLQAHAIDGWSRAYWAAVEDILEAPKA